MESVNADVNALHQRYLALTQSNWPTLSYNRECAWLNYLKRGLTAEHLQLVILHLKMRIRAQVRHPECLKFSNLFGDEDALDRFEEELGQAEVAMRRKPADPERVSVLRATFREEPSRPARSAAQIMAEDQAFRQFQAEKRAMFG